MSQTVNWYFNDSAIIQAENKLTMPCGAYGHQVDEYRQYTYYMRFFESVNGEMKHISGKDKGQGNYFANHVEIPHPESVTGKCTAENKCQIEQVHPSAIYNDQLLYPGNEYFIEFSLGNSYKKDAELDIFDKQSCNDLNNDYCDEAIGDICYASDYNIPIQTYSQSELMTEIMFPVNFLGFCENSYDKNRRMATAIFSGAIGSGFAMKDNSLRLNNESFSSYGFDMELENGHTTKKVKIDTWQYPFAYLEEMQETYFGGTCTSYISHCPDKLHVRPEDCTYELLDIEGKSICGDGLYSPHEQIIKWTDCTTFFQLAYGW